MKVSFYIVIFMICFGASDVILNAAGFQGVTIGAWDSDQIHDALNATRIVEAFNPSVNPFFDVGAGLRFLWNINEPLIGSFGATLEAYGTPQEIVNAVRIIYRFAMVGIIIEFISGREFMP